MECWLDGLTGIYFTQVKKVIFLAFERFLENYSRAFNLGYVMAIDFFFIVELVDNFRDVDTRRLSFNLLLQLYKELILCPFRSIKVILLIRTAIQISINIVLIESCIELRLKG